MPKNAVLNAFAILPIVESAFFADFDIAPNVVVTPNPNTGKPLYSSGLGPFSAKS